MKIMLFSGVSNESENKAFYYESLVYTYLPWPQLMNQHTGRHMFVGSVQIMYFEIPFDASISASEIRANELTRRSNM